MGFVILYGLFRDSQMDDTSSRNCTIDTDDFECNIIKTKLGNITGIRLPLHFENGMFCGYRGIRYAEPPIGSLRFKVSEYKQIPITSD